MKQRAKQQQCNIDWLDKDQVRTYDSSMRQRYYSKNPAKYREYAREGIKRLRLKVLEHLGGPICCKCGFLDSRALQIDHINGGGNKETKNIGGSAQLYRSILNLAPETAKKIYQILCANCNWIKRSENKESFQNRPTKYEVEIIQPVDIKADCEGDGAAGSFIRGDSKICQLSV